MSRWRRGRVARIFTVVSMLAAVSMLGLSAQIGTHRVSVAQSHDLMISTKSDDALSRVHPALRDSVEDAPDSSVLIHAYILEGTDLSAYMPDGLSRAWVSPQGITIVSGTVRARNIVKLADVEGVLAVEPLEGAYQPASEPAEGGSRGLMTEPGLVGQMAEAIQSGERNNTPAGRVDDAQPTGWYDILNTHNSQIAWEKGFTGAGVKVMVNDSGVDFAHPDLFGTWATVDNPDSPYLGWPLQFDAFSMFLFARDTILGESNIASGAGHYADTSTVITADDPSYQPLDSAEARSFTLTGTSLSGEYHIGTHPDTSLRPWSFIARGEEPPDEDEDGAPDADAGERPAILVVDEKTAGVYDTVYVDLDFDNDFSDEKPMTKDSPVAGADWWGAYDQETGDFTSEPDGYYDISAGLVYWISDGVNPVPAADWWWEIGVAGNGEQDAGEPGAGNLVLFSVADYLKSPAGNHGTLVASAIAAQGVIDGDSVQAVLAEPGSLDAQAGGVSPSYKPADAGGIVQGAGRDVEIVSAGDFYPYGAVDAFVLAALGYDGFPNTGDEVQIINNSWGASSIHNDGWDAASRLVDAFTRPVNPTLLVVFSAGNGSPGFGTTASPSPMNGLTVGSSTQHGSTGWDSATGADQITYGDVASFSGRGPGARGETGVHVLGSGSRASGDVPVNEAMSGWHAWTTWGGTSRSAPVVAGNAALVYQAFRDTFGFWPNYEIAKMLLMSGATDLDADPFLQGAGAVNAARSVDLVTGEAGYLTWPYEWRPGDYHGQNWPGFANIVTPGASYGEYFQFSNPTNQTIHLTVTDQWMQKVGTHEFDWTSSPISSEPIELGESPEETAFTWDTPHYLWNITDLVPEDADMVVMRFNYPMSQFDPAGSYAWEETNSWYLNSYDWTDVDGDGQLWTDSDGDGVVDESEIDQGEWVRFEYSNNRATTHYITVGDPHERVHDGLFLGLQHSQAREDVPQTDFTIGLDFYKQVDMPWMSVSDLGQISVPPLSTGKLEVRLDVPGNAEPGMYEASVNVSDGYRNTAVPVTINVAANGFDVEAGERPFNDDDPASYYNNERLYGAQSWRWSEESGDWRFYYSDLPETPGLFESKMPDGSYFLLADAIWDSTSSDVDLHILSPFLDQFSDLEPSYYGPYTLNVASSSNFAYAGEGVYVLDTTSGENREIIAAPYAPGLNAVLAHNTNFAGTEPDETLQLRTGVIGVSQSPMEVTTSAGSERTFEQTVMSSMPLSGLVVQGFGLSRPVVEAGVPISQEDPNDPSTSSFTRTFSLDHAGLLDIQVAGGENDDIDLFLLQDLDGDGEFNWQSELVAASTTPTAEERIRIQFPADGDYMVAVHGWAIPGEGATFDFNLLAVQGEGITATGAPEGDVSPYRAYTFNVAFDTTGYEPGEYTGLLTIGPPEGPSAVLVFANVMLE